VERVGQRIEKPASIYPRAARTVRKLSFVNVRTATSLYSTPLLQQAQAGQGDEAFERLLYERLDATLGESLSALFEALPQPDPKKIAAANSGNPAPRVRTRQKPSSCGLEFVAVRTLTKIKI
jgi:hypothetical protein